MYPTKNQQVARVFFVFLFCVLKQSMSFLLHPTKKRSQKIGQVALGSTKVLWMNSEPWIQVFTLPETDSLAPENGGPLEVWRGTYWNPSFLGANC